MTNYLRHIITCLFILTSMASCQKQGHVGEMHSVDATSFKIIVNNNNVQIVDVRTRGEFLKGHLPNAINIDIKGTDFNETARQRLESDRPVAVYCHSGKRSKIAAGILVDMGFEVYELDNGVLGWDGPVSYDQQ